MSSDRPTLLKVENVTKRFRLGEFIGLLPTLLFLKGKILSCIGFNALFKRNEVPSEGRHFTKAGVRYLWALRDVSFELKRGERVAILGRNAAGKSTLLKILVGIMAPTSGVVATNCRIVPLMGVGAGFNPQLTGRENVFIYGGLLGVSISEIKDRYDDIVEFSEIAHFMDTPLKRYSKGMRARLGMAVALNLAPELLVVDEVLAVGDIRFRAKCMERIEEICNAGTTLLFVSHSVARVKALCDRAILLRDGQLIEDGLADTVLQRYLAEDMSDDVVSVDSDEELTSSRSYLSRVNWGIDHAPGDDVVNILEVRVANEKGEDCQLFASNEPIVLEMCYIVKTEGHVLRPQFQLFSEKLESLFVTIDVSVDWRMTERSLGVYQSQVVIPADTLGARVFVVGASVYSHQPLSKHARTGEVVSFKVRNNNAIDSAQTDYPRLLPGYYSPKLSWSTRIKEQDELSYEIQQAN